MCVILLLALLRVIYLGHVNSLLREIKTAPARMLSPNAEKGGPE